MEQKDTRASDSQAGMVRRVRRPQFERELITAGSTIIDSIPRSAFRDERQLNNACLLFGHLAMFGMDDETEVALYKLNGLPAVGGRARKEGWGAYTGIFMPDDASEKQLKRLEKIQARQRRDEWDGHKSEKEDEL